MEIIYDAVQTVAENGNVLFSTDVICNKNKSIYHRPRSGLVQLKGMTKCCFARYKISFGGNVALPTGATVEPISLAIALDNEVVPGTTMISTPTGNGVYNNIFTSTYIDVPACCCASISIKNTSGIDIDIQNSNLIIERVA